MTNRKAKGRKKALLSQPEKTPYDILGVSEAATRDEIRSAYLRKVRLSPPEKDPEGFQQVRKAYGLLIDSEKKRALDLSLFKTESHLDADSGTEYDFTAVARQRLFQMLLSSSDLYVRDFSRHFHAVKESVEELR